jgi:heme-degrading monooxygenase HmoA
MNNNTTAQSATDELRWIYRIDKFKVPSSARKEFIDRVHKSHEFLRTLPGFVQDCALEQTGGPGEFNFITIVIWNSMRSIEAAREAVKPNTKKLDLILKKCLQS